MYSAPTLLLPHDQKSLSQHKDHRIDEMVPMIDELNAMEELSYHDASITTPTMASGAAWVSPLRRPTPPKRQHEGRRMPRRGTSRKEVTSSMTPTA